MDRLSDGGIHFGNWLRDLIESSGVPLKLFAERVGVSEATLHAWMSERLPKIRGFNRGRIAKATGKTKAEIDSMLMIKAREEFDNNIEPYSEEKVPEIPLFEWPLAAGGWVELEGIGEVCDARQIEQGLFRVRLRGDSMKPLWPDGTIVEFKCHRVGRDELIEGRDYYFQRSDGTATFKRLAKIREEEFELHALNKKYPKMTVERALIVRMALAIGRFSPA